MGMGMGMGMGMEDETKDSRVKRHLKYFSKFVHKIISACQESHIELSKP